METGKSAGNPRNSDELFLCRTDSRITGLESELANTNAFALACFRLSDSREREKNASEK